MTETFSPHELRQLFGKAKMLRSKYINKIPDHMVEGKLTHKVQKGWFNSISMILLRPLRNGKFDEAFLEEYSKFDKILSSVQTRNATKEDIDNGDAFLKYIMEYCREKMEYIKKAA